VTAVPAPTLNGVWAFGRDVDTAQLDALLDEIAATGLPHCLQVRADPPDAVRELAVRRGLEREADIPLMVLDDPSRLPGADAGGPAIRQLAPDEADVHVAVAAAAFGAPPEVFAGLINPATMRAPGVRVYIGEVDGEPVATGLGATLGDSVGVFSIATAADHRRRGYGAAVSARAVRDGLEAGASWAWLQSSEIGYGVYEALGFRTVERWPCWVTG
jgi:GNAT superfamily N-acetyltransferase